jgi:hypothetical protein
MYLMLSVLKPIDQTVKTISIINILIGLDSFFSAPPRLWGREKPMYNAQLTIYNY